MARNSNNKLFTGVDLVGFLGVGLMGYGTSLYSVPVAYILIGVLFFYCFSFLEN